MQIAPSPIQAFCEARLRSEFDPVANVQAMLARANGNLSRNTYITLDSAWSIAEARRQWESFSASRGSVASVPPLWCLPVSLKDCFDLEGFKTSVGSKFYAAHNQPAPEDAAITARLKTAGAIITGKTHLHQLAYGITGENGDYGNCVQPADGSRLTGGSSSGAAASIQEGSALAAIGTDTGGSIRVPAALCGLAGYRSSYGVADWRGGAHLARSFDTVGWLFRDLRDAPLLAEAIFDLPAASSAPDQQENQQNTSQREVTIGVLSGELLNDCDDAVQRSMESWQARLLCSGARLKPLNAEFWSEAWDIYVPLQAYEAAKLHAGFFHEFDPAIAARLEWGAAISQEEVRALRLRNARFREQMQHIFYSFDFLLAPSTPLSFLDAGKDQTEARARILRFTLPASLAGLPVVVLPSADCGLQLIAAHNQDRRLLRFAAQIGQEQV
jgi:Asp-tRNA(Asn)/Glu-tRNA(Gln) amidotransferase A subunit family amidase